MEKEFEIINHTADVGIIAYGADMNETFANAAKALFSLITELDDVEEAIYRDIELTAPDQESLLVEWLNELIYLFDAENIIFKRFDVTQLSQTQLESLHYSYSGEALLQRGAQGCQCLLNFEPDGKKTAANADGQKSNDGYTSGLSPVSLSRRTYVLLPHRQWLVT